MYIQFEIELVYRKVCFKTHSSFSLEKILPKLKKQGMNERKSYFFGKCFFRKEKEFLKKSLTCVGLFNMVIKLITVLL